MTNQQILDLINQNIRQNGNEEITGNIMNSVLRALLDYINSKIIDNKFLIFQTEEEANNYLTEAITLEGVLSYTVEIDKFRYIYNGQWKDLTGNYLLNPENTGDTTQYPFVVGLNNNGETAKLPAGDLGKNFANTNLVVSENRNHTGSASVNMGMPFIFSNSNFRLSSLQDKSNDATFNQILGKDSNGNVNEIGIYGLINSMSKSNDSQKDLWRSSQLKPGENYSTGQVQINSIIPTILFKNVDYVQYITLSGLNMFLNHSTTLLYIYKYADDDGSIVTNPILIPIENYEALQNTPTILTFGIDAQTLENGQYKVKIINNGIESISSPILYINENFNELPLNTLTWNFSNDLPNYIDVVSENENGIDLYSKNNINAGVQIFYCQSSNNFISLSDIQEGVIVKLNVLLEVQYGSIFRVGLGVSDSLDFNNSWNIDFGFLYFGNKVLTYSNNTNYSNVGTTVNVDRHSVNDNLYIIINNGMVNFTFEKLGLTSSSPIFVQNGLKLSLQLNGTGGPNFDFRPRISVYQTKKYSLNM